MNRNDVYNYIINCCIEIMPELTEHDFDENDRLEDLGLNSMDRADVISMGMEYLSLNVPRIEIVGVQNIGDLVDVLHSK